MDSIEASTQGLKLVEEKRRKLKWSRTAAIWCDRAFTSKATLGRFWQGQPIRRDNFEAICAAVGVNWEDVVGEKQVFALSVPPEASLSPLSPKNHQQVPCALDDGEIRWVGRADLLSDAIASLQGDCRLLWLVGMTGIGKTSLAVRLMLEPQLIEQLPQQKTICFDCDAPNFRLVARQILGEQVTQSEKLQKDSDLLARSAIAKLRSNPCLLILDMLEAVLQPDGEGGYRFIEPAFTQFLELFVKAEAMPSRIILTSQDCPPVLAEGRYGGRSRVERLKGLTESEALQLFEQWDVTVKVGSELDYLKRIIAAYEGHPLALRVIAGEIRSEPYNGDIQAYWHEFGQEVEAVEEMQNAPDKESQKDRPNLDRYSPHLKDLVKKRIESTFKRLQEAYPLACFLLCKAAVARRATERRAWLFTIRHATVEEQEMAFEALQRRFLLDEERTAHKVLYRLHNLIRRIALENLPKIEEELDLR